MRTRRTDSARSFQNCPLRLKKNLVPAPVSPAARAEKEGVALVTDIPADLPSLFADERMMKQILINLLSNAVKFTPEGGAVTLSATADQDGFALRVVDTGIGIPADKLAIVLEPFGQADSRLERVYEGTGLGLPLVKSMAELHGGTLTIRSAVGKGTTVAVVLPSFRIVRPQRRSA